MRVFIAGIERPAVIRSPNGVQCDECGQQVNFDRADSAQEINALRGAGWAVGTSYDHPAYCPSCESTRALKDKSND